MSELFETQFAYSPENQQLIKGATFTAHDVTTGDALATTDALGSALTLMSDSNGALPPFKVAGDRVQVEIRNGAFKTVLTTTAGVAARESVRALEDGIADPESPIGSALTANFVQAFAETAITYDSAGNVTTVTENGITTTYTYNGDGSVATDSRLDVTREYTYDGAGNLVSIEEA